MFNFRIKRFLTELISRRRRLPAGIFVGRQHTHDGATITYRMGAGFEGDITRVHPFDAEPALIDPTNPPLGYGRAVVAVAASNGVRNMLAGDTALTAIYGITVRSFPGQPASTVLFGSLSNVGFGSAAPPAQASVDVLRKGYIIAKLGGATAAAKGGAVFVWVAASAGSHTQGGFEAAATAGSTIALDSKTTWNGPADASGFAELAFNI